MKASEILRAVEHRPWALPSEPWVMMQVWSDLLFAHWPLSVKQLRCLIPAQLEIDTFDGQAWVAIAPFRLWLRPRGLPALAGISRFPELNCRTYVKFGGKPGVFFFSLDAGSRLAVWGARKFYLLPYFYAHMAVKGQGSSISYSARRSASPASFDATYRSQSGVRRAQPGTLEHFLIERYCLYTHSHDDVYRAEIHHHPWPLQDAACEIRESSIAHAAGIDLPATHPVLHFARELTVLIWRLRKTEPAG
jgi:uncharacterized protein